MLGMVRGRPLRCIFSSRLCDLRREVMVWMGLRSRRTLESLVQDLELRRDLADAGTVFRHCGGELPDGDARVRVRSFDRSTKSRSSMRVSLCSASHVPPFSQMMGWPAPLLSTRVPQGDVYPIHARLGYRSGALAACCSPGWLRPSLWATGSAQPPVDRIRRPPDHSETKIGGACRTQPS